MASGTSCLPQTNIPPPLTPRPMPLPTNSAKSAYSPVTADFAERVETERGFAAKVRGSLTL